MKICLLLPLYSITSFLAICFPTAAVSLTPWMEVYQGLALGLFFLLLCAFIARENEEGVGGFFETFDPPKKRGKPGISGVEWFGVSDQPLYEKVRR
jgi:hypothetical protein